MEPPVCSNQPCGQQLLAGSRFCHFCGRNQAEVTPVVSARPLPPPVPPQISQRQGVLAELTQRFGSYSSQVPASTSTAFNQAAAVIPRHGNRRQARSLSTGRRGRPVSAEPVCRELRILGAFWDEVGQRITVYRVSQTGGGTMVERTFVERTLANGNIGRKNFFLSFQGLHFKMA